MVLGKEFIITNLALQGLFEKFFGEKLLVQDAWFDQTSQEFHLKVGKIGNSSVLKEQGFVEVKNPGKYEAKEILDAKIGQIVQSAEIMLKEW